MSSAGDLPALARALLETSQAIRSAVVSGDAPSLPGLAERERALAEELRRWLAERQAAEPAAGLQAGGLPSEAAGLLKAWWQTHQQNRLLLQHAHRTVSQLLALLEGAAAEPVGLYGPDGDRTGAARIDRRA